MIKKRLVGLLSHAKKYIIYQVLWQWIALLCQVLMIYCASMLLEQEISPKVVQKLLGHRDVSTTLGVYSHVVPEVFTGVTAVVNTASEQLLAGTYAPRQGRERVLAQLRQLDPLLGADGEGA